MKLAALNPVAVANRLAAAPAVNPRKVSRGTSYTSTGLVTISDLDDEQGSSATTPIQEVVPELSSPFQRRQTYARMMNDAGVDVSVRAVKTPVLGSEFFVEPYSDDPQDVLISDFIWDNLSGGMSSPFLNSLEDILTMYEESYSVLEKVYELREWSPNKPGANNKKYTMLKKLGVRPVSTIKEIVYDDNGGPEKIVHTALRSDGNPEDVDLDIAKLMIFTFGRRGGKVEGKSILRTAYPHWYYKTHFYKIDAIQKERHSLGVPRGKLLPGFNSRDRSLLRQMLRNLRSNEEAFLIQPPGIEVDFAEVRGNLVDVLKSAEHHNTMLLMNVMAQFLALGTTAEGGGRATAGSGVDMFMKSLKYVANYICEVINMYLIPELVVSNFPTTNFPQLQVRNIGETRDLQMLGAAIANLLSQGGFEMDDPTENWLRRVFDMPLKDRSTVRSTPGNDLPDTENPTNNQKGGVKNGKQTGNLGKPANAANGDGSTIPAELAAQFPMLSLAVPPNHSDHKVEFNHETPVEVKNQYEFEHHHQSDTHIDEGAVQVSHEIHTAAPHIDLHLTTPAGETVVHHVQPKSAIATKLEDGSTRIDYIYEENGGN